MVWAHLASKVPAQHGNCLLEGNRWLANDPLQGTTTIKPIENSVDEVKVLTGTLPAEYGHSAGGVITTVKKSGTNEFHGAVSDFGRTPAHDASPVLQFLYDRATAAWQS